MVIDRVEVGRYEVLDRSLRLHAIGSPPLEFWVAKIAGDRLLIETSEEDSYWIRTESLELAMEKGWIRLAD